MIEVISLGVSFRSFYANAAIASHCPEYRNIFSPRNREQNSRFNMWLAMPKLSETQR
jgi:hypothetical protein